MGLLAPFQPADADYANGLAAPQPDRKVFPRRAWVVAVLLAVCLVPRAAMVLRIPGVCPDGVYYIHIAEAIEQGDFAAGTKGMALNPYPFILAAIHRLGFDWESGAALWGVVVSTLVVLPLWGWVRRQFDDRIAIVACLLYAINPKMIEWSPEVMRDPTFWLFFTLAIYWLWRAVTEVRLGYYLAGGAATVLAALTRFEGLFLLIPLVLWTFWRLLALERPFRWRLVRHVAVGVTALLAIAVSFDYLVPLQQAGGSALRTQPWERARDYLASFVRSTSSDVEPATQGDSPVTKSSTVAVPAGASKTATVAPKTATASAPSVALKKRLSPKQMIWIFIPTMTRGLSPVFALLMFGGIWGWLHVWRRRDQQAMFYAAVAVMAGILVQMQYDRNICPRYALPIVLMASPLAALGLMGFIARLSRIAAWLRIDDRWNRFLPAGAVGVAAALSVGTAMTGNSEYFETRRMAETAGNWIKTELAEPRTLVGPVGITPIVSYYAGHTPYQTFFWETSNDVILQIVKRNRPAIVLLQPAKELRERCNVLSDGIQRLGMQPVSQGVLPIPSTEFRVYVREGCGPRIANQTETPTLH